VKYLKKHLVITKTPYRISLGGGGTDLPFYSKERGGLLISASINQYITISVATRPLDDQFFIQTTDNQFAHKIDDLRHPIIREVLRYFKVEKSIQVATFSTLPTSTGLGSSSALIVGLIHALTLITDEHQKLTDMGIAKEAHKVEREIIGLSGGIQDQYISALGGIQILKVNQSGEISAEYLMIEEHNRHELERGLVLVYTGEVRNSEEIIESQKVDRNRSIEVYDEIKEIGIRSVNLLKEADIEGFGRAMDDHWKIKRGLSAKMTNGIMDELYIKLKSIGSPGGKIIGAGGGGFFMMAVPGKVDTYLEKVNQLKCRYLDWRFEFRGTHAIEIET
jgi:D-glycero-alpha-D-manno-heptose-7-phosphate kinase